MRDIPVGNGSLLVTFDDKYQIRDVYFPHVGQENHTEGFPFRFGVWVDGNFSWVASDSWHRSLKYLPETLVTDVTLTNAELGIELKCHDTVASHENIFLRRIRLRTTGAKSVDVRIFLHQDFRIYENKYGDTAFFDPDTRSMIHNNKHRYFLINTEPAFRQFATGRKAFRDQEGTFRDAEDGQLSGGPITEGSVDSIIGCELILDPDTSQDVFYWIAAGSSYDEVVALDKHVRQRRPQQFLEYTENYWRAWVNKNEAEFANLPPSIVDLYKRSLLIVRTQIDNTGAILAANDSDVTERATDHYSYLWTRDGAFVANALDLAGYSHLARKFYEFCGKIVHKDGYFLQKYNPDGTVASGWHSAWDAGRDERLIPIQEDETALVLWALWEHYDRYRDIEFAHGLYGKLITKCADFMLVFRDQETKLPLPSWNLWEDRKGIHTFTCSTVVAGLRAAANFAELFADVERAAKYRLAVDEIVHSMRSLLFSTEHNRFLRSLQYHEGRLEPDATIDASMFAIFYFACVEPDDPMVESTMLAIETVLGTGGGIARFEHDSYMRGAAEVPSNSWFICTLWLADYFIARARPGDRDKALSILNWTVDHALPSGVLAEQLDPTNGQHVSVSPLTWSHSTFIATVQKYLAKSREIELAEKKILAA
jgi:oligosaccharide amylase